MIRLILKTSPPPRRACECLGSTKAPQIHTTKSTRVVQRSRLTRGLCSSHHFPVQTSTTGPRHVCTAACTAAQYAVSDREIMFWEAVQCILSTLVSLGNNPKPWLVPRCAALPRGMAFVVEMRVGAPEFNLHQELLHRSIRSLPLASLSTMQPTY